MLLVDRSTLKFAFRRLIAASAVTAGAVVAAGCAATGTEPITTSSVPTAQPKVDPACVTLTSQIETLRKEGVADKVANAAAKKYKMKPADLAKADELNKANADFQAKCSTITPKPALQAAAIPAAAAAPASVAPATKAAAPKQ